METLQVLNNYNGMMEIFSSLQKSSVFRLKMTKDKLPNDTKRSYDRIAALLSTDRNYLNLREALHHAPPPVIPYLGMYLTDILFIHTDQKAARKLPNGMVLFTKWRLIGCILDEMQRFQDHK